MAWRVPIAGIGAGKASAVGEVTGGCGGGVELCPLQKSGRR